MATHMALSLHSGKPEAQQVSSEITPPTAAFQLLSFVSLVSKQWQRKTLYIQHVGNLDVKSVLNYCLFN